MTDEERLVLRILDVLPPVSFELSAALSLFRIRYSDEVETACVTCTERPELLINRAFVETHCRTDEHLFMLVMHELYHVILGHTALFPQATPIRNVVFDAVINAILCTQFPDPAFTSFLTDYYPSDRMPYAVLRPRGTDTPQEAKYALWLLYDKPGTATYQDVFQALVRLGCPLSVLTGVGVGGTGGGPADASTGSEPVLLGSHGTKNPSESPGVSPDIRDLLGSFADSWPVSLRSSDGRGPGTDVHATCFAWEETPAERLRRGIARLMHQVSNIDPQGEARSRSVRPDPVQTVSFLPDAHDRTHATREAVLGESLLYHSVSTIRRPSLHAGYETLLYFDVSGSVGEQVPRVADALRPYFRKRRCRLYTFSTVVQPVSAKDLSDRTFRTTGGTDINCVLRHVLDFPLRSRPRSVVLITDGQTGMPEADLAARFRANGFRLTVGLVGCAFQDDLRNLAESVVELTASASP